MAKPTFVEMAEIVVSSDPDAIIVTLGLGSCVGLCVYDGQARVAGVAHIALPDSALLNYADPAAKFADLGTVELISRVLAAGAAKPRLVAALVGGAQLYFAPEEEPYPAFDVGQLNVRAVRAALAAQGVPVVAEDIGGSTARSLELRVADGRLIVRTVGAGERDFCVLGTAVQSEAAPAA
jgi:chemotaxis protein CheD